MPFVSDHFRNNTLHKKMRKARNANKSFLTGTALLAIAVIAIVFIFVLQADELSKDKQLLRQQDRYELIVSDDFAGMDISVYLNDSLVGPHASAGDTIVCNRLSDEPSLLVVDHSCDRVVVVPIPIEKGTFVIRRPAEQD